MIVDDIIEHYQKGFFLMGQDGELSWYTVKQRTLIPLDERFHIPKSLGRVLKSGRFHVRINTAFFEVVQGCAARDEVWISSDLKSIYYQLHHAGYAHSFETWEGNKLAGGILGISLGGAFIGESMFYAISEGSKVAMVKLVEYLQSRGFALFDAQVVNHHTARFGAYDVPDKEYQKLLSEAIQLPCRFV